MSVVRVKFTQSARKHRIGRAHVFHVINSHEPEVAPATPVSDERRMWIGQEDRGVGLEIIAVVLPEYLLIIHVLPTALRRKL